MKMTKRRIKICSLIGTCLSFVLTLRGVVHGRIVSRWYASSLFPGDTECVGVGKINLERSSAWLSARFQKIVYIHDAYRLVFDWKDIAINFLGLIVIFFLISCFFVAIYPTSGKQLYERS